MVEYGLLYRRSLTMFQTIATFCLAGVASMLLMPALAADLSAPQSEPVLVISGAITSMNVDNTAVFDREMLEALGSETIVTKTPWFDGESTFSGVRLDKLMEVVGARGEEVTAIALNDYVTTIPIQDFADFGVILALKRDGEYMAVRNKGPLFIIYPYDSDLILQSQTYFGRSAWQVAKLVVK